MLNAMKSKMIKVVLDEEHQDQGWLEERSFYERDQEDQDQGWPLTQRRAR